MTIEFSKEISDITNRKIRFFASEIESANIKGVLETVPTFCSITIYFNPLIISSAKLKRKCLKIIKSYKVCDNNKKRVFLIPVCYSEQYAPDMEDVCKLTNLTKEEVINIHSSTDYLIYMLGFLPGFPYLGGMDKRIEVPRLDSPRTVIPSGAVGIGGKHTGVYPLASPGGWRLIGQTPLKLYDSEREKPILYNAGDYIRFYPITADVFAEIVEKRAHYIEMREKE